MTLAASVEGEEIVEWFFQDDYGVTQHEKIRVLYSPLSIVCLFSPQEYMLNLIKGD